MKHLNLALLVFTSFTLSASVTTVEIGSSANLFTIVDGSVNSLAANNEIGTVAFIHRTDPSIFPSNNIGQYRYDLSTDNGQTWSLNNGLLNPSANESTLAGRFPQAVIHNPAGNTNSDSAYLSYQGTWFTNLGGTWDGLFAGVARLDNDSTTFTENVFTPYNNDITHTTGLCNGSQDVFWSVSYASKTGNDFGSDADSIILYKGTFNASTNDISWQVDRFFEPGFDQSFDGDTKVAGLNMAFDPSGQYGWIVMLSDVTPSGANTLNPVVYKTVDGGDTWTGPETVDLSAMQNVVDSLQGPNTDIPTTAFDCDIVVDKYGNPHIAVVVGSSIDYAISTNQSGSNVGFLKLYDITYDNNTYCGSSGGSWKAVFISDIATFRGQITAGVFEDNRPQASLSPDGSKVFFSWLDSDPTFTGGTNEIPNFHVRGFDVDNDLATTIDNWTKNDPIWEGGALFGIMSPSALEPTSGTYNLPAVFTRLNASGSETDPVTFHYVQDIIYEDSDFTINYRTSEINLPQPTIDANNEPQLAASAHQDVQYTWYKDDDTQAIDSGQVFTASVSGCYRVRISDLNNPACYNESDTACIVVNSIEGIDALRKLKLYPNPNSGNFQVLIETYKYEAVQIDVFNNIGKEIYHSKILEVDGYSSIGFDLSDYSAGIYYMRITIDDHTLNRKISITR